MNIKKIKIKNFKVFENDEFSFNPKMNIIIGNNATGKTSLLEALSYSLGTFFLGINSIKSKPLSNHQKRRKILDTENIEVQLPFRIDITNSLNNEEYTWYRDTDKEKGGATSIRHAKDLINKAKELDQKVRDGENVTLPLIAYYGTDRVNDKEHRTHVNEGSRFDGYYASLDQEVVRKQFLTWFRDYEDSVLKFGKDKALYNAFTEAITTMVKDWKKIHYSWKAKDMLGQLEDGTWTPFSMLSAGYKNIVRLTADIAYRAIVLNPHLGENVIKETEGVVLIDEVDMHLHPKWQKSIINDLKTTFPKIQFIITTHSPFIIQSLKSDELISLDSEITEDPYTKSIPDIVEDEMNLDEVQRSEKFLTMQRIASQYFNLIKTGKNSNDDDETREIKEKLDELELEFNNDPVFVALMKAERKTELD